MINFKVHRDTEGRPSARDPSVAYCYNWDTQFTPKRKAQCEVGHNFIRKTYFSINIHISQNEIHILITSWKH